MESIVFTGSEESNGCGEGMTGTQEDQSSRMNAETFIKGTENMAHREIGHKFGPFRILRFWRHSRWTVQPDEQSNWIDRNGWPNA